jgi:tRNA A-37 threonylcarbamoyl transferase component Bud32
MYKKYFEKNDYNDNLLSYSSIIELNIVKIIKQNSNKSKYLPQIYNINLNENYYEMEILDFNKEINIEFNRDVNNCLNELHKLNIIYIDLCKENIGYSIKDNVWKIIDFNMSGICTPNKKYWIMEPEKGTIYNKIQNLNGDNLLTNYDNIAYLININNFD